MAFPLRSKSSFPQTPTGFIVLLEESIFITLENNILFLLSGSEITSIYNLNLLRYRMSIITQKHVSFIFLGMIEKIITIKRVGTKKYISEWYNFQSPWSRQPASLGCQVPAVTMVLRLPIEEDFSFFLFCVWFCALQIKVPRTFSKFIPSLSIKRK